MPVGKGRHSPIAADDQGRAIAVLLKNPQEHIGKTIPLSGPVEMDHEQMVEELSEAVFRCWPHVTDYDATPAVGRLPCPIAYIGSYIGAAISMADLIQFRFQGFTNFVPNHALAAIVGGTRNSLWNATIV
jgi:hypothetical protein